uniref:Uncharacterized protein n=1 Tax=Chromera velia CCMP2878 TaxID=1169474 RepID=A0A0G4HSN5_9ALVE|eukprot:Cvel_31020.t1-p1 / transcript=Cvel_31020.t1 / gene=Cvel_31020 / organism=Chromera_velia_CCMP2878 / gene_product=Uncharacterized WD repeat-containing protein, putative / transcript_product=Uncharacterized WD repeat-containing protein, putative / location=Cvel_scaffold4541:377-4325(-) / protein_length=411 / sequence_SO=supercontig / SO=protein_coding / is_pseudo=false
MSSQPVAISAITWVPKGVCKARPDEYVATEQEKQEVQALLYAEKLKKKGGDEEMEDAEGEGAAEKAARVAKGKAKKTADRLTKKFDLQNYDAEDDYEGSQFFSAIDTDGVGDDPNLREGSDSEEEAADEIRPTDLVLVTASAEQDWSVLEVHVFDDDTGQLYVHHDVPVGAYPLCVEWLSKLHTHPEGGNLVAVGSFEQHIDIWDLDVLDALEPVLSLGDASAQPQIKKKKKKGQNAAASSSSASSSSSAPAQSHSGPVLCLHRNPQNQGILASGSADETVRVWDLGAASSGSGSVCLHTYGDHTDKVQALKWHPVEPQILLSAGYDRQVVLLDVRTPDAVLRTQLSADAESAIWDHHAPTNLLVSAEDGTVTCWDARSVRQGGEGAVWKLQAHSKKKACTGVAVNGGAWE